MEFSIEIIFSILITAITYLLVPVIVILTGKKLKNKAIITITIVNCVVFWFVFRIIEIELYGKSGSGAVVFLWGAIGYWLMKRNCLSAKQGTHDSTSHIPTASNHTPPAPTSCSLSTPDETTKRYGSFYVPGSELAYVPPKNNATSPAPAPKVPPTPHPAPTPRPNPTSPTPSAPKTHYKYCSKCGNAINPETKKCTGCGKQYFKGIKWQAAVIVILAVLLVVSVAQNVYLYRENDTLYYSKLAYVRLYEDAKTELHQLEDDIANYEQFYDIYYTFYRDNYDKVLFVDNHVVFIADDGTNYYHKYECCNSDNYIYVLNTEYAKSDGYSPCPLCFD